MRVLALIPALAFPAIMGLSLFSTPPDADADGQQADPPAAKAQAAHAKPVHAQPTHTKAVQAKASGNDCAVMAAVAKEHYKFGADHAAPPLKGAPKCDWSKFGLAFTDWNLHANDADPRDRLKWVEFKKPTYDSEGATIETSQMAGPMAGTGYSCRLRSGIAGWTVTECKTIWVS